MPLRPSASSFSSLRSPLLRLSKLGTNYRIEVIVTVFCAVTLVYFQLLKVVRTSEFLVFNAYPTPQTASVTFSPLTGLWSTLTTSSPVDATEIWMRQLILDVPNELNVDRSLIEGRIEAGVRKAMTGIECYSIKGECWETNSIPVGQETTVRSFAFAHANESTAFSKNFSKQSFATIANVELIRTRATRGGQYMSFFNRKPVLEQIDDTGDSNSRETTQEDMQGARWVLLASRAFVMRFWGLLKQADSADIFVMLLAYLLMHSTFISLFINMRRLSLSLRPHSRSTGVWLFSCSLVSSCLAFFFALLAAWYLDITVNPVLLGEALPFLVITVGFEKPFVLTRAVFSNPAISPSGAYNHGRGSSTPGRGASETSESARSSPPSGLSGYGSSRYGVRFAPPIPSSEIVLSAVAKMGVPIVRDYVIEVAVLVAGAMSGVAGLREFCQLAALILIFDCLLLMVFYVAVLTIMVEIHRIKVIRHFQRTDSSADLAKLLDDPNAAIAEEVAVGSGSDDEDSAPLLSWKERAVKLATGTAPGQKAKTNSPTARLKLLLIASFLILHFFDFARTLTTQRAYDRSSHTPSARAPLDVTSPLYVESLANLVASLGSQQEIVLHIAPAIHFTAAATFPSSSSLPPISSTSSSSLAILDRFMSRWSKFVGDPVMSKWIVVALGLSVFLNSYLLKGIASGSDSGFAPGSAAEAAARILLASTGSVMDQEDAEAKARLRERWSGGLEGLQDLQKEWTSEDASAMTKFHQKRLAEDEAEAGKPVPSIIKVSKTKARSDSGSSSEESTTESAIFVRPNPRRTTITAPKLSTPIITNGTSAPTLSVGTERAIRLSPSAVALVPQGEVPDTPRSLEVCLKIFDGGVGAMLLNDEEIILLVQKGKVAAYALEKLLNDLERSVFIRRALISRASSGKTLESSNLPFQHFDYSRVVGQCCENVVGYLPLPVGIAGPLRIDGIVVPIPMATTEGALVASTSRGCKALNVLGGVTTVVTRDAMTRGPALDFPSIVQCAAAKRWIDSEEGANIMKAAFNATSRFARLQSLKTGMAGRQLFVRFCTQTGDAMGMNMISKGTEAALETMGRDYFPQMTVASISGNYCTDKKPAAINWIEGRGKSVVAEGIIPGESVKSILKTTVAALVKLNITKNLIGSAMAGTMGGNNAHAANVLAAIFLATGQDPAQVVESANCITLMEAINDGEDLLITCSMPSVEVGTIGGGTILLPQAAMLDLLGVKGPHPTNPGQNAQRLARIICAAVLAGELSLMSALAAGSLVKSHMIHNRSAPGTPNLVTPMPSRPSSPNAPQARVLPFHKSTPIDPLLVVNRPKA